VNRLGKAKIIIPLIILIVAVVTIVWQYSRVMQAQNEVNIAKQNQEIAHQKVLEAENALREEGRREGLSEAQIQADIDRAEGK
jgi:predicted Holliday junction resolvase-like endonuclease